MLLDEAANILLGGQRCVLQLVGSFLPATKSMPIDRHAAHLQRWVAVTSNTPSRRPRRVSPSTMTQILWSGLATLTACAARKPVRPLDPNDIDLRMRLRQSWASLEPHPDATARSRAGRRS